MRTSTALRSLALGLLTTAMAKPQYGSGSGDDGGHGGDDSSSSSLASTATASGSSASPSATSSSSSSSNSTALVGMKGGAVCTDLLCVGGLVNGSTITYTLQSLGSASLGWMAMGFGAQMANTPMVIMWPNSDGSVTLSQRKAPSEVMPTVDSSPPRTATAEASLSTLTGTNPKLVFTIPVDTSSASDSIIWAFSNQNPGDTAVDATLLQHLNSGPTALDLTQTLSTSSKDPTNPAFTIAQSASGSGTGSSNTTTPTFSSIPLETYEKYIVAHAILLVIGFLFLLPLGAIIARYLRTFSPVWFKLHWVIQWVLSLPIIVSGFALGVAAVHENGVPHLNDTHKKWGLAIFLLYLFQLSLGGFIHFVKVPFLRVHGRTFQNYVHAMVGIFVIGISFYQVRTGFRTEWPAYTGRGPVKNGANITWIVWLVLVAATYFAGMLFIPRQYRQEERSRLKGTESETASIAAGRY